MPFFSTIFQVLILAMGVYMLLALLRSTRGSGLVRGLGVTMLLGMALLWVVSSNLQLDELQHIIKGIVGFVFVILAIIFQPELRRGIVSLGEHRLLGRFFKSHRKEVISEVALACISMARKNQGALIAFERETPLDVYIEGGVKIDSEVNRLLLDALFHHGNALHDGAVVIRGDRIEAAACLFPLTENVEISKSTGTRHRAALGLTEETDAVTVAVSEENGLISIAKRGSLDRRVARNELEQTLRERIGTDEHTGTRVGATERRFELRTWLEGAATRHVGQKLSALAMAVVLFYYAYNEVRELVDYSVDVQSVYADETPAAPTLNQFQIVLPDPEFNLASPIEGSNLEVSVVGTRSQLQDLRAGIGGVLVFDDNLGPGTHLVDVRDVWWGSGSFMDGLEVNWTAGPPELVIDRFATADIGLTGEHLTIDTTDLDIRYEAPPELLSFSAETVTVRGPVNAIQKLRSGELEFGLRDIRIAPGHSDQQEELIALSETLEAQHLTLEDRVYARVRIVPSEVRLEGLIEKQVGLVVFDPERMDLLDVWEQPSRKARFEILTAGVLPGSVEVYSATDRVNRTEVINYVTKNLRVYIDVSKVADSQANLGTIETGGLENWRKELGGQFEDAKADVNARIWVELADQDSTILLKPIDAAEDSGRKRDEE